MSNERIFVVEDERIVAEDLKRMLERLGYEVVGLAAEGEDAIRQVEGSKPDLVLMDIRIRGPMDGIEVAEHIYTHFDVPVSYLTAFSDETTLDRAKATLPFGYILKPFEERNLQATIEMALYRHKMDSMLKKMDNWQAAALKELGGAVVATDTQDRVRFMNKTAEKLLGRALEASYGKALGELVQFQQKASPHTVAFLQRGGRQVPLQISCSPIKDEEGSLAGFAWVLKEPTPAAVPVPMPQ